MPADRCSMVPHYGACWPVMGMRLANGAGIKLYLYEIKQ